LTVTTPQDAIRARRRLTNKFIAAHDAARLKPFFDPQIKVIVGDGSLILGAEAVLDAFAAQFKDPTFIAYVRTPEDVRLDAEGVRASESGSWTAEWQGAPQVSGVYLAAWRKVTGQWVIESETFVTLS
jgi:ketosteroid isomerase-like protein